VNTGRIEVASFFHWRFFILAPCILGLPIFSSDVFYLHPLHFRVAFFSSEFFDLSPLHFGVAAFFIEGL
jgi:hypothetical protein